MLGLCGLFAVFCLHFPELLTTAELRRVYSMGLVRAAIQGAIGLAFLLGLISAWLRRRKVLGFTGMALAVGASLLGGSEVPVGGALAAGPAFGLDWFVLNLLLLAVLFVPMERLFPQWPKQGTFRPGWTIDTLYFFSSHLLVQMSTFLTLTPAHTLFQWAARPEIQLAIARQPLLLQLAEVVIVADLTEYFVHRLFHRIPWLWRFHAVHHSSRAMDWLAGSRLHIVDIVVTRGLTFVPLHALGFAPPAVYAYLVFVSFHAVFIHANVRFRFGVLEDLVVVPRFHHWHHATAPVDKNFAVHLPWIDRLFGTHHCPPEWPAEYGIEGDPVPEGYLAQWSYPLAATSAWRSPEGKRP